MFLANDSAPSIWSGSTDSKTLYNQRTPNPREYQIVRTQSHKLNHLNTRPRITHPPVRTTQPSVGHLIQIANRTKIETQSSADRITPLNQPCTSEGKNKKTKNKKTSAQISPNAKLTQTIGPTLCVQKLKGRKNAHLKAGKRRPQTQ